MQVHCVELEGLHILIFEGWIGMGVPDRGWLGNFLREIYIDWSEKRVKNAIEGVGATMKVDETKIGRS